MESKLECNKATRAKRFLLYSILGLGICLRIFQFPNLPPGIWADEASAGYESLSLLTTGHDRWGVPLPIYFTEWGAGQNVLYSYLSIPLIAFFGLSQFSTRLLALMIGILTIPLTFLAVRRLLGEQVARWAIFFLALLPWHIMASRWGHEANIFPFLLLLACYGFLRALEVKSPWIWKGVAMGISGASLYAYAVGYLIVPVWQFLIVLFNYRTMIRTWRSWVVPFFLFGTFAFPIGLFLTKNMILHSELGFERYLPFGIPLLAFNRAAEVSSSLPGRWITVGLAIVSGFQNHDYQNAMEGIPPVFVFMIPLAALGGWRWAAEWRRRRTANVFLLWLGACLPLLMFFDFGILRFSAMYVPLVVAAAFGYVRLSESLSARTSKYLFAGVVGLTALQSTLFSYEYFLGAPAKLDYQFAFAKDFDVAIRKGVAIADFNEDILVTNSVDLPEMLTAFYLNYPPDRYQREEKHHAVGEFLETTNFGRFYIGRPNYANPSDSFVFVLPQNDKMPCFKPIIHWRSSLWMVGQCKGIVPSNG